MIKSDQEKYFRNHLFLRENEFQFQIVKFGKSDWEILNTSGKNVNDVEIEFLETVRDRISSQRAFLDILMEIMI